VLNRQFSVPGGTDLTEGEQETAIFSVLPLPPRLRVSQQQAAGSGSRAPDAAALSVAAHPDRPTTNCAQPGQLLATIPSPTSQVWMDVRNVVAVQEEEPNGDHGESAPNRNRLIF